MQRGPPDYTAQPVAKFHMSLGDCGTSRTRTQNAEAFNYFRKQFGIFPLKLSPNIPYKPTNIYLQIFIQEKEGYTFLEVYHGCP